MPKIALHQKINGNMDPVLQVTLSEHPEYTKGAFTTESIEHALKVIGDWLKSKLKVT